MSININVTENIGLMFDKLEDFIKNKTIFGEPMQLGDTTLIPVINVSFGLGSGGGDGSDNKGNGGVGGGGGIGAKASPTALIIIKDGDIEIKPIKKNSGLEKLLEMVPDLVDKINVKVDSKDDD